ncbi:prepilin peptidase [Actinomyces wuliandei]|uniref:prepilin peptidase n=1 Tax=Actinomyces wuliandei TaxID=2057743 RepID=UPI000FDBBB6F|nr:prepilin peptidase [Actinomyces wuliandei]
MISAGTVLVLATAVAAVAVAAGPACTYARGYLTRLEALEEASPPLSPLSPPRVRARWLLAPLPQAVLSTCLVAAFLGWGLRAHTPVQTVLALPVVALTASACSVDAVCHRLPNRLLGAAGTWLVGAAALTTLARLLALGTAPADATWPAARALLCALGAGGVLLVMAVLPSGLGLGDVKLGTVLGGWLGHVGAAAAVTGLVLGFLLAGAAASALIVTRRVGRRDHLALGPYLAMGGWLAWVLALA